MAYTKEEKEKVFTEVCRRIAIEGDSLRKVLRAKEMPSSQTFFKWMSEDPSKTKRYAYACNERADIIFEDILHIADDVSKDTKTVNVDGIETETINKENIQRSRLRVDARKWMLSKMIPKKYGDKLDLTVEDNSMSKEERMKRIEELRNKLTKNL